jgi:hypothetical protein
VREKCFKEIGGFTSPFWSGEDTKFCLDLIKKTRGKILYDPGLIVYHHRRQGLFLHLDQVGRYGLHRGYFAKRYPQTSLRFKYVIPSLFLVYLVGGGIVSLFSQFFLKFYFFGLVIYSLSQVKVFLDIKKYEKNTLIALHALYYVFFTHLVYGAKFIQGLLTKDLKE